eukprot:3733658-Amphidinium_carterae.1
MACALLMLLKDGADPALTPLYEGPVVQPKSFEIWPPVSQSQEVERHVTLWRVQNIELRS